MYIENFHSVAAYYISYTLSLFIFAKGQPPSQQQSWTNYFGAQEDWIELCALCDKILQLTTAINLPSIICLCEMIHILISVLDIFY